MTSSMTDIMKTIIEFLYAFWIPIDVIGMGASIVSLILPRSSTEKNDTALAYKKRLHSVIVCSVAFVLVLLSGIVRNTFTVVPEITGQKLSETKILLTSVGLNYDLVSDFTLEEGTILSEDMVIWASREAGELVYNGDTILLFTKSMIVNPEIEEVEVEDGRVVVPDVVGLLEDEAMEILEENGLAYSTIWTQGAADTYYEIGYENAEKYVIGQYIPENSIVDVGTEVVLEIDIREKDETN